jgi:hypothetical protein
MKALPSLGQATSGVSSRPWVVELDLANVLNISAMDNLKLRVSYGVTGNQPNDSYISLLRLGPQGTSSIMASLSPDTLP